MRRRSLSVPNWGILPAGVVANAAIAAAFALALLHLAGNRGLWLDEALVAYNIRTLDLAGLAGPLAYDQLAPLGWLWLEKLVYMVTGSPDLALRLPALGAWLGAALLFRSACFRLLEPAPALGGVLLFLATAPLLRYAGEIKPYMFDVLAATAALRWAAAFPNPGQTAPAGFWAAFAATGLGAAFFTLGGVLAVGTSAAVVAIRFLLQRRWRDLLILSSIGLAWAFVFLGLFRLVYSAQTSGSDLVEGGADAFFKRTSYAPLPTSLDALAWYGDWTGNYLSFMFSPRSAPAAGALAAIGFCAAWLRSPQTAFLAAGPVILGLAVSAAHAYPMFDRLSLFTLPGVLLACAAALAVFFRRGPLIRFAGIGLAAAAVGGSLYWTAGQYRHWPPYARHDLRPVLKDLKASAAPGDAIYVQNLAIPGYLQHHEQYGLSGRRWIEGGPVEQTWGCMVPDLPPFQAGDTIWIVLIYNSPPPLSDPALARALAPLGLSAVHEVRVDRGTAMLHRVELTKREAGAAPMAPEPCVQVSGGGNRFDSSNR